jgi:hypothetical protein
MAMPRSTVIFIRYLALAGALSLSGIYLKLSLPMDGNVISLKACIVAFLGTYLTMTTGLLLFNRLRKFDIALICWAALSGAMLIQHTLAYISLSPIAHISEAISGVMGILACLLPLCVATIRGEARGDRQSKKYIEARSMVTVSTPALRH